MDDDLKIIKCDNAVEATDYEELIIWQNYDKAEKCKSWEQVPRGMIVEVGRLGDHPVCVQLRWHIINGYRVLFYEASSRVVDHVMIEEWIRTHALNPNAFRTNAMNFHNVWNRIK